MLDRVRNSLRFNATATLAAVSLAAVGCGASTPPRCDRTETVGLRALPGVLLNPDREGFPRSVVIRFYQLQDVRRFQARSFESVWAPRPVPPSEPVTLARPDEWVVLPGRSASRALRRDPKATHLAIAANFREHRGESGWRATWRLPPPQDPCEGDVRGPIARLDIILSNYALQLR